MINNDQISAKLNAQLNFRTDMKTIELTWMDYITVDIIYDVPILSQKITYD